MYRRFLLIFISLILTASSLSGCNSAGALPEIADDEILLLIQFDFKEDIGLLVVEYETEGKGGEGGSSNADKSLLKRDDLIYYSVEKRSFDNPSDTIDLTLRFKIITEYFDPNYDNIYPEEYTVSMNELRFDATFGQPYRITITGDKTGGYTAVLTD